MKKVLPVLGLFLGLALTSVASAEESKPAAENTASDASRVVDQRMQIMTERLKLTPEQAEKIRTIMLRDQEKFVALRDDKTLSQQERTMKIRAILQGSTTELQALLTPEQKEIWKEEAEKQRKTAQERRPAPETPKPEQKPEEKQ